MSQALRETLAPLGVQSEEMDYAKTGMHTRHTATVENVLDAGKAFLDAGYILEMLTCQDLRESDEGMRLCYTFNNLEAVDRHLIHVDIAEGNSGNESNFGPYRSGSQEVSVAETFEAPTMTELTGGANWQEREVFEMYGVTFTGHPQLERLLLPEDADFFPLRKDFGRIEDAEDADAEDADE